MKAFAFKSDSGQFVWHFKAKGNTTANNETFPSMAHAVRACKGVIRSVAKQLDVGEVFFRAREITIAIDPGLAAVMDAAQQPPPPPIVEIEFSAYPFDEKKGKKGKGKKMKAAKKKGKGKKVKTKKPAKRKAPRKLKKAADESWMTNGI